MDQAFKQAEEYRNKSKILSNISRVVFIASIVASVLAVFMPYLLFTYLILVPVALAIVIITEVPAVVYRFKARKVIRTVITIEDPSLKKETTQDVATLIVMVLFAVIIVYVLVRFVGSFLQVS